MNSEVSNTDPRLSNPFSTSVGGVTFEHLVGASYLVSLLAMDVPRGLDRGIIYKVRFQQRWSGAVLDDIVVTSHTSDEQERHLALQVKHDLIFSDAESNTLFRQVVSDCWQTFTSAMGWPFDSTKDRIGIAVGEYSAALDQHLQRVLDWARTSESATEFKKIEIKGFSSAQMRRYVQVFRNLLTPSAGREISNEELWQFLRCLVVLYFDFEHSGSRDATIVWNRLLDQLAERDDAIARNFFNTLTSLVERYARDAAGLTLDSLREVLGGDFPLRDQVNCGRDLARLREHSDRALGSITTTLGSKLHLPRTQLLEETLDRLKAAQALVITGEPGVGKSVLLHALANRLRQEGEILVTSVERLSGPSLEAFAADLQLQNDFQTLLGAVSSAPLRCLLIDRLEKATFDPNRRRVLNDLVREIKCHNEKVISRSGHPDACWRIVATCWKEELADLLPHLALREDVRDASLQTMEVDGLTDEELNEVSQTFPRLSYLISQEHVQPLLRRPLVLDFLTLPEVSLPSQALPEVFTETWLMDLYWHQVIRLANGARDGIGSPDAREQTMLRLGKRRLEIEQAWVSIEELDAESVMGLARDRVIKREDALVRLAHDVLEDWVATRILASHREDLLQYLKSCEEFLALVRPLRLLALRQLEKNRSPEQWLELLSVLRGQEGLSPRWYQTVLTAPLFSPLLQDILGAIEPHLLADEGQLLSELLQAMRTISTAPSPTLSQILVGLPQPELEKYLAYGRDPIVEQWLPVLGLILKHKSHLPLGCLREVAEVVNVWMKTPDVPLRKDFGQFCLDFLRFDVGEALDNTCYAKSNSIVIHSQGTIADQTYRLFKGALLWAADCLPEQVERFVNEALERDDRDLPELLLQDYTADWVPLCRYLPGVLADATERLLCQPLQPDRFESYYWLCMHYGIHNDHGWRLPPTYMKGPFLGLLRLAPEHGIRLIARMTDHATIVWRECENREWRRTPLPQTIHLSSGPHQIWGDERVYAWFRYPNVGPHGVTCALMALEHWMDEQIKAGTDPQTLFETVLSSSSSAAVAGVCVSVALADWRARAQAVLPILEQPAFWFMDRNRAIQEGSAASFIEAFDAFSSDGDRNIARQMAEAPHRRLRIDHLAQAILLGGPSEAQERLQKAMGAFPENPPFFFEEERQNRALVQHRVEVCEFIAAAADLESYEVVPGKEEGTYMIQLRLPEELEKKRKESERELDETGQIFKLLNWTQKVLDEGQSDELSLNEALELAKQLAVDDNSRVAPRDHHEELRAQAIALAAAAFIERGFEWIKKNEHLPWCRQQLLLAASRPEKRWDFDTPKTQFRWDFRRSAARALPRLLQQNPRDTEIRRAILGLVSHPHYEVRVFLFNALRGLWSTDPEFVWLCIALEAERALRSPRSPSSGITCGLKQLVSRLEETIRLAARARMPRSLANVPLLQIDYLGLACVLYALPVSGPDAPLDINPRHLTFMDDLIALTIKLYRLSKETYHDHSRNWIQVPLEWSSPFFELGANWTLYLPPEQAEEHILQPILSSWEQAFGLAEELLRALLLAGSRPELHSRFVEVWRMLVPEILESPTCRNLSGWLDRELRNMLGLLVLYDPTGIVSWKIDFWEPVLELTDLIDGWVEVVGHHPECFPSLVGLLRSIGFRLFSVHGINWLFTCFENSGDPDRLFKEDKISSSLAILLHDAWYKQGDLLRTDSTRWHQFVVLVDYLAAKGEQVAVELQRKIQQG